MSEIKSTSTSSKASGALRSMTYLEFGLLAVTVGSTVCYVTLQSIFLVYRYLYFIFALTLFKFVWGEYTHELRGGTRRCSHLAMKGKTVVMTGGTAGTGRAAATQLASRGARIILGCRDLKKADAVVEVMKQETCNNNIIVHRLDLSSFKSVREFADKVRTSEDGIDVLINNASVSDFESHDNHRLPHTTVDGLTHSFQVNYLSHFLLSNLLLTLLVKRPLSRIINITARLHTKPINLDFTTRGNEKLSYPRLTGYTLGKLANVLFTKELALRLDMSGVKVYAVDPGLTFWKGHKFTDWKAMVGLPLLWLIMSNEDAAAQTTIYCATEKGLRNGDVYFDCRPSKYVNQLVDDDVIREKLWEVSLELTQLNIRKNGKT